MSRLQIFFVIILLQCSFAFAQVNQIGNITYDESLFYAEVKQVNQFFRRFNNEEDAKGHRYDKNAPEYHNNKTRESYLLSLFDRQNAAVSADIKNEFIQDVTNEKSQSYLDFFGDKWYAEITTQFMWNGEPRTVLLYLKLEAAGQGYKWVISNVDIREFDKYYKDVSEEEKIGLFLHPMSHETDFMNINKAFQNPDKLACYVGKNFKPNHLSLFVEALSKQQITFMNTTHVKFHFLQFDGWWFEINYLNRSDVNSGWLITNILKLTPENQIALKRTFDYEY